MEATAITIAIEAAFFFLGISGVLILFIQWRRKRDRLAQVLCLAAFGTWVLSVITASALGGEALLWEPATVLAAIALGFGLVGACMTLTRTHLHHGNGSVTRRHLPSKDHGGIGDVDT